MNWAAAELLQRFAVHGRFYRASFNGQPCELRSHLEIFEHDIKWRDACTADADLVAVMMNPGASRPTTPVNADGWATAVPDRTQYQLMKLALNARDKGVVIRHIRVINLSDLRTPKSAELFATMSRLGHDGHSLFSKRRATELRKALGPNHVPVLRAWGLASPLKPLAELCLAVTSTRRVLGLTDNGLLYRHPLPQRADLQRDWLNRLGVQIAELPRAPS
jgi:hypothetical protein